MKIGDVVVASIGWRCRVLSGKAANGTHLVEWLDGPLAKNSREARIDLKGATQALPPKAPRKHLRRSRIIRDGKEIKL